jgi:Ni/Fe-hydrogenase subunit HybB-like protein
MIVPLLVALGAIALVALIVAVGVKVLPPPGEGD